MAETTVAECSDFQTRYLEVMRGWNAFDLGRPDRGPDDAPIIDFDVAPAGPTLVYERMEDILDDLEELAGSVPADEPDFEVVAQTVRSNVAYARARAGEPFDFADYTEATIGFRAEPVEPGEIERSAARLDEILQSGGLRYNADSTETYFLEHVLHDPAEIRAAVRSGLAAVRLAAGEMLDGGPELSLEPEFVTKDDYGVSAVTMLSNGEIHWEVNVNPDRHPLDVSRINTIDAHEITGHIYHILTLKDAIEAGEVNPILGIAGVHMPFAFQTEAIAQLSESLYLDDSWQNTMRAIYNQHVGLVIYDAQWRVNHGEDPKAVSEALTKDDVLPFEPPDQHGAEFMELMRDHPLYRTYLAAYDPALRAAYPLYTDLDGEQQRAAVQRLYRGAFTPSGLIKMVTEAVATAKEPETV